MNFKKYLKLPIQYQRNIGLVWKYGGVVRKLGLIHLLIPALLIPAAVVTITQVPNIRLAAFKFNNPKPIVQSSTYLSANIQSAIQNLAREDLKQEGATANLSFDASSTQAAQGGIASGLILNIQEALTSNPSEKAKLEIKIIDNLIGKLQKESPDQLIETIKEIGSKTDGIVRNPKVQADRGVLQLLIEQYNRLQLILQQLEDNLPVSDYLKVEDARQKYLVVTAMASINNAPNLDAVHNIAIKEVAKVVGSDFAELKAIEIISDFEAGVKPEAREKLSGLEKQLAVDFEKKMLKLPRDVRERKLQNFIKYSFGNPIRQVQSFGRMKNFLSNKELISGVEDLRKIALQKVSDRIYEANLDKDQNFLESELKDPQDIKALEDEVKKLPIVKLTKEQQQQLYEKMQQIVQTIFLTSDIQKSDLEKQLPQDIQNQIQKLKQELADRNVPKIETPEGITLPEVAKLPENIENAIVAAAKKKIEEEQRPKDVELDLSLQAKDLGVSDPVILPGNPLYILKQVLRTVELVITLDPVARAEELIKQDNEKTLEAAKLVEQNQDMKTLDLALETLKDVQNDFDKLKEHAPELKQLNQTQPEKVSELVNQIIENGLARQTVLASIEDKVYGDTYVEVEKVRSDILKDGVDTLLQLTDNNVVALTQKLEAAVENSSGSELKDIKAVELLTEISRTQPETVQQTLDDSIETLAQKLEDKLLSLPEAQRIEQVLDYVNASPGNPVIVFEAADELKSHFDNPKTIALTEGIKDQAVENLTNLISEITDGTSKQEFVDTVIGDNLKDLKIITDIEIRVTPPQTDVVSEPTPIVEQIQDIKARVEQNIIDTYKDNPQKLVSDLTHEPGHVTDILDVKTVSEIADILTHSPEVTPEVIKEAQKLEGQVVDNFLESVSTHADQALTPVPEVIEQLVELKDQTSALVDIKIDAAIKVEVNLIEEHLTLEVNDPFTFENYVTQIKENPIVANIVAQVGGTQFAQALDSKAEVIQATATSDQSTLVETVKQIEQEIFSTSGESQVEQTLPTLVQEQIQEIKTEVPIEQVPTVSVEATVSVTAPAAPKVKPPETQSEPASAVQTVPGL